MNNPKKTIAIISVVVYSIIIVSILFFVVSITAVNIMISGTKKYFSQPGFNDDGFHFNKDGYFLGYKDINLFKNLKDCHTYETPIYIFAPMGIKRDKYKTKIIGINNNYCKIQNLVKYPTDSDWKIIGENNIPLDKAKRLSLKIIQEFNNPSERIKNLEAYCQNANKNDGYCSFKRIHEDNKNFTHIIW